MASLKMILICLSLEVYFCSAQRQNSTLPASVPSAIIRGTGSETCPAREVIEQQRILTKSNIIRILNSRYYQSPCACGGSGGWSRIAYLDMNDTTQQCPSNWRLITSPVRGCGRRTSLCNSAIFPVNGRTYSHVCGRVFAYQRGSTNAFDLPSNRNLDDAYLDGVSLTHGVSGSRQHIWSFVSALYEQNAGYNIATNCACTNTNYNWTLSTPSFVGKDYFCDTGNPGPDFQNGIYYYPDNDPLWDGEGCGSTSTCCEFNNPPWFCKTLPQPTSDDIELRICGDQPTSNEDVIISLVDINVQ